MAVRIKTTILNCPARPDLHGLHQGFAGFFCKGLRANILGFAGRKFSIVSTQLCHCSQMQPQAVGKQTSVAMFQKNFIYENRQGAIICLLPDLEGLEPCPLFIV